MGCGPSGSASSFEFRNDCLLLLDCQGLGHVRKDVGMASVQATL